MLPLQFLNDGESATIEVVEGEASLVTRLNEMGLREGTEVHMIRTGEPCIVAVGNHRLTFRGGEAAHVFVNLLANAPHPTLAVTETSHD